MWRRRSPCGVKQTLDRLEALIAANRNILRLARIDQAAVARAAGVAARPMEMLLFENRVLAAKMIAQRPEAAFELPIRALAWEDEDGQTWVRVTDPDRLDRDAGLEGGDGVIETIHRILGAMLERVVAPA